VVVAVVVVVVRVAGGGWRWGSGGGWTMKSFGVKNIHVARVLTKGGEG